MTEEGGAAMDILPKKDVGLFLADIIEDTKWDGKAVQLYASK